MPSRIDIGPEGGPFVAINENNNDLELQDINGNVIAKWDETAGHWDFANNSLTNLAAVETDRLETNSLAFQVEDGTSVARDFGTPYQNTTGNTIEVTHHVRVIVGENGYTAGDRFILRAGVSNVEADTLDEANRRWEIRNDDGIDDRKEFFVTVTVPPGSWYEIGDLDNNAELLGTFVREFSA